MTIQIQSCGSIIGCGIIIHCLPDIIDVIQERDGRIRMFLRVVEGAQERGIEMLIGTHRQFRHRVTGFDFIAISIRIFRVCIG